jgi:hypothetical protein
MRGNLCAQIVPNIARTIPMSVQMCCPRCRSVFRDWVRTCNASSMRSQRGASVSQVDSSRTGGQPSVYRFRCADATAAPGILWPLIVHRSADMRTIGATKTVSLRNRRKHNTIAALQLFLSGYSSSSKAPQPTGVMCFRKADAQLDLQIRSSRQSESPHDRIVPNTGLD